MTAHGFWWANQCDPMGQGFTTRLHVYGGGSLHPGRATLAVDVWGWRPCECGEGGESPDWIFFNSYDKAVILRP